MKKKQLNTLALLAYGISMTFCTSCNSKNHNTMGEKHTQDKHHHHHTVAEMIKHLDAPDRDSWQKPDEVIAFLGDIKGKKIMDIGAATGYFSFKLANAGAKTIAADVEDEYLQILKEKKEKLHLNDENFEIRKVDFNNPKLKNEEVDAVIIVDVYHHINDRVAYFKKVLEGLKPDGKLLVVDYKKDHSITDGPSYEMRLTEETVINELMQAGFADFKIDTKLLQKQYIIEAFKTDQKDISGTEWMKERWEERYGGEEYVFGTEPNKYFAKMLTQFNPGKLLLPGEGEGRNAVFAAKTGWDVYAFDYSSEAKKKAEKLAMLNDVKINYSVQDLATVSYPDESFDAIAYMFIHFSRSERVDIHRQLDKRLKKGGIFILEAFSTEHPKYSDGGPQDSNFLYSKEDILRDFSNYDILELKVEADKLDEGESEMEDCSILRFVGRKK